MRDDRLEHAQACARACGLDLYMRAEGLTLSRDGVDVRGDFSRMRSRVRSGVLSKELLVRACRVKGVGMVVYILTDGLKFGRGKAAASSTARA